MSHRLSLRALALTTAAVGAVLVPSTAAFASDATPKPRPGVVTAETPSAPSRGDDSDKPAQEPVRPSAAPRGGVDAGDEPKPAERRGEVSAPAPRGGVDAGEQPAADGNSTATLVGSAAALALVAGAGTLVIRRRTATRNG